MDGKRLKIIQLFETYGDFYQPYIPPVISELRTYDNLNIRIDTFNGDESDKSINILPGYHKRKLKERVTSITKPSASGFNYIEYLYLKDKIDIIHVQQSYLYRKLTGLLTLRPEKRPKVIITLRGADSYMKPWLENSWKDFYKNQGQYVDAFVTMTNHQKEYMQKWNIPLSKIHVIPISYGHAFKTDIKSPDRNQIKIFSAFRMCWEKNIEGNLRVIKQFKERGYPVIYDIYGSGQDSNQVPYLIDKYNLQNEVTYHGKKPNTVLKQNIKESDFCLQLSHSESLGMSVIEAQTYGLPAIVSDSDGLPEVVMHGQTGFCVKPYDIESAVEAILKLWNAPELYSKFSENAIKHSQNEFAVIKEAEALNSLYNRLITE